MRKTRVGVVGAGNIASIAQLPTLVKREDTELAALVSRRSGSSRWQDGASVLRVENTGRSLSPTLVPTLTEPFQHGPERIRTGEHAGVGLGLAIVHSIVPAHDGTLDFAPRRRRTGRHDPDSRHAANVDA
jgi:nitrogen fixation/metabolism regulation signal transduction histidine kinase